MTYALRLPLSLLVLGLLSACASTELTDTWKDPGYSGPAFKKILVLGFATDQLNRKVFEDTFAAALKASGVEAVPSYTLIDAAGKVDEAELRSAVAESGSDAVLITRLVNIDKRTQYSPGQYTVTPAMGYHGSFYGYYGAAWAQSAPPAYYEYQVVTLETNLWDVETEQPVWSGATETFDPQTVRKETEGYSKVVIGALKEQGLI